MARFTIQSETSDYVVVANTPHIIVEGLVYNSGGGATALNKGQVLVLGSNGKYRKYTTDEVENEVIGTGDGTTLAFQKILDNQFIRRKSVTITTKIGAQSVTLTDNGEGYISNTTGTHKGSIDYSSGIVWLLFATAPDNTEDITIDYTYANGRAVAVLNEGVPAGESSYPAQVIVHGRVVSRNLSDNDYATKRDLAENGITF